MEHLIARLEAEQCSCVIRNGSETLICRERGVKDLYNLYCNRPAFLKGSCLADKVVGKGAAALMALGGVQTVYAGVISLPAFILLKKAGAEVRYGKIAPFILNRNQTDWCPLEKRCQHENNLTELFDIIRHFLQEQANLNLKECCIPSGIPA